MTESRRHRGGLPYLLRCLLSLTALISHSSQGFAVVHSTFSLRIGRNYWLLSSDYLENDLVAVPYRETDERPRLCVVRPDGSVLPLCQHEDDVETDLFLDPRAVSTADNERISDETVVGRYGEGWYGQRPVPSLGGGPGYGAEADEIWSVSESVLEEIANNQVDLPVLDVGIAHGEKARGGAF